MKIILQIISCLFSNSIKILVVYSSYSATTTRFETALVSLIIVCYLSLAWNSKTATLMSLLHHIKNDEDETEDYEESLKQVGPVIIINSIFSYGISAYALFRLFFV